MPSSTSSQKSLVDEENQDKSPKPKQNKEKEKTDIKRKNIFNKRLDSLKDKIMNIIDHYQLDDEIKKEMKDEFDKAATDMKVCKDMENAKDSYMIQGASIKNESHARTIALSIIGHKATGTPPEHAVDTNVIKIMGKKMNFFKIQTAKFDVLHTDKTDGSKQSIGQTLLENIESYNKSMKNNTDKIYVSHVIPRCLKPHYKSLEEPAYKIRALSTDTKKFITKIHLDSTKLRPCIKVKITNPKSRRKNVKTEWFNAESEEMKKEIPAACLNVYKNALKKNEKLSILII